MPLRALLLTSSVKTKNKYWTCSTTSMIGSIMPPADLLSIAGTLQAKGIEARVFEMRHSQNPFLELERIIDEWNPDAVITGITTTSAIDDYEIFRISKEKGVPKRIAFNFHAMAMPDEVFANGATHILVGDPEHSVVDAMTGKNENRKGLWTINDKSGEPGWIENLDTLPYPALDLINIRSYYSLVMGREPFAILLANRGCLFNCSYCTIPYLFGKGLRVPSVQYKIDEIEYDIKTYGVRSFIFLDAAINLNPKWTVEFCNEIIKRKLKIKWCSNMRVNTASKELLTLMKKAGCYRLFYGVEDLDMVKELNRNTNAEQTIQAFKMTRESGIEAVAFIILIPGIDDSEKAMIKRMTKMLNILKPTAIQCNIAVPFPGTKLYSEYKEKYHLSSDWNQYDPGGNEYAYESNIDLVKARSGIYLRFYLSRPLYLLKTLSRIDFRSFISFINNAFKAIFKN